MSSASLLSEVEVPLEVPGWREIAVAVAGPAAVGLCVGWAAGATSMLWMALLLPLAFLIVGVMTLPGFYIGAALWGVAPSASTMFKTAVGAFRDQGIIYLGLAPAMLFLCTTTDPYEALVIGSVGVFLGAGMGMRAFSLRLDGVVGGQKILWIFGLWAAMSAAIGWEIYLEILRAGGLS